MTEEEIESLPVVYVCSQCGEAWTKAIREQHLLICAPPSEMHYRHIYEIDPKAIVRFLRGLYDAD
jgi:hypothetical protein